MIERRARVLFLVRVAVERTADFLRAYELVRHQVSGVPGHLVDQVCRSDVDPEQWLVTSEWATLADFEAWERSAGHRELLRPMRECFTEARSLRFLVHAQTPAPEAVCSVPAEVDVAHW
ncbi:antibiotic biosynthesis monooxygenase family protein [Micromonospora inyonensis]|uniref:Heme-degrading monooxygenase HmoA n=1 Tax=Micromonospora inyonensis TaxID=47866 RepID=A0A1C6SE81_9ACTN|nr:antibiotic biosynthesis monooxygenase family protein [Micromonospora inyonensis]SCL27668.1 Heme-degrading monooxygenase HmoA [Micromonospora inyonensis]